MNKAWKDSSLYSSNYKSFWEAVAKMETAGFQSRLYLKFNNPWGMKVPKVRPTTADKNELADGVSGRDAMQSFFSIQRLETLFGGEGKQTNFAVYPSLEAASKDIILWMEYVKFKKGIVSLRSFVEEMNKHGYFAKENPQTYYNKIVAWENR